VKKKFANYKLKLDRNAVTRGSSSRPSANVGGGDVQPLVGSPSFFARLKMTPQKLFEIECKHAINSETASLAAAAGVTNTIRFYQPAKSSLWNRMDADQQADFVARAAFLQKDVATHQEAFEVSIKPDMHEFVKGGVCGDMTMTLFFAYRTPDGIFHSGR
jgi:hypothetical protein